MALIADGAFDAALNYIKNGLDRLDICTQQPADATAARTNPAGGNSLGNEAITGAGNTTGPQAGDVDGRELQINAITDGDVTATGNATHWAISNSTVLLASGTLSSSQQVTSGNKFTLGVFDITIRDAT